MIWWLLITIHHEVCVLATECGKLLSFMTNKAGLKPGDVKGVLKAETVSGKSITGSDTVKVFW